MKRPTTLDSRGLAAYHRSMRARQERDERELMEHGTNPEVPFPFAYTQAMASGVDLTANPDLAADWALQRMDFYQVEPIARELDGRQLVVGESGIYGVDLNVRVAVDAPADPDDVAKVVASIGTPLETNLTTATTVEADSLGGALELELNASAVWPLHATADIRASLAVEWAYSGATPTWSYSAELVVWWYARVDVPAPDIGSS